jgi:CTP:molybdopterin cytidylyltransferase MocA
MNRSKTEHPSPPVAIVILAAGIASRMGSGGKQLALFEGVAFV